MKIIIPDDFTMPPGGLNLRSVEPLFGFQFAQASSAGLTPGPGDQAAEHPGEGVTWLPEALRYAVEHSRDFVERQEEQVLPGDLGAAFEVGAQDALERQLVALAAELAGDGVHGLEGHGRVGDEDQVARSVADAGVATSREDAFSRWIGVGSNPGLAEAA